MSEYGPVPKTRWAVYGGLMLLAFLGSLVMVWFTMPARAQSVERLPLPPLPSMPYFSPESFRERFGVAPPVGQHAHGDVKQDNTCRLGDFLCNHAYYHRVYVLLELVTGKSCCHNSEGRPTRDIEDLDKADPKDKVQIDAGFVYKAWVDGQWCPAKEESLLKLKEVQREVFFTLKKTNPELFYSFLELDHVFAPPSKVVNGVKMCPVIYCLFKKKFST